MNENDDVHGDLMTQTRAINSIYDILKLINPVFVVKQVEQ